MSASAIFAREEELRTLREKLAARRSFLFHGPPGVGKTLMLRALLPEFSDFLYCERPTSGQAMFRSLILSLLERRDPRVLRSAGRGGAETLMAKSAISAKGIVMDALHDNRYAIVLDHLRMPSQSFAASIREVLGWGKTPVVAVAHSPHMEDLGFLAAFYPDRADRLELKNFDPDIAESFARRAIERAGIWAHNVPEFLDKVLEVSRGNPGAILSLVSMARQPKYLAGDHIKIAPLYIDFRLNWNAPAR
jgi:DNA polymerase III delta prime subunit